MDKLYGICYSVILGDSFGSNYEGKNANEIDIDPKNWKVGMYTDDTVMTLGTMISIQMKGYIDPEHMSITYARMYDPMRRYGAGTSMILQFLQKNPNKWATYYKKIHKDGSFGNGGLMRVAPLAVYCMCKSKYSDLDKNEIDNYIKSCLYCTHNHPFSIESCRIYIYLLINIVFNKETNELLRIARQLTESHRMLSKLILIQKYLIEFRHHQEFDDNSFLKVCGELVDSILHTTDTLAIVMWTYLYGIRFFDENPNPILFYQKIIKAGGDTDTNAAILGGFIGAKYGMWFDTTNYWAKVENYKNINVIIDSFIKKIK